MIKLILDPGLFELEADASIKVQMEYVQILNRSIDYAFNYFDASLDSFDGAAYMGFSGPPYVSPPITSSPFVNRVYQKIKRNIACMMRRGQSVDLTEEMVASCAFDFTEPSITKEPFLKYLSHVVHFEIVDEILVLLSQYNQPLMPKVQICAYEKQIEIASVFCPAIDCNQIVAHFFKNTINDSIFPRKAECQDLNAVFLEESRSYSGDKRPLYEKYGRETATRNGYFHDQSLTKKNPNYHVFAHSCGKYYLSIDREHGGLEMFSHQPLRGHKGQRSATHLGEYNYSCCKRKDAAPETHKLYL